MENKGILFDEVMQRFGRTYHLSNREKEICETLCLLGLSNEQLAELLQISPTTVRNHMASILKKTRYSSSRALMSAILRLTFESDISTQTYLHKDKEDWDEADTYNKL